MSACCCLSSYHASVVHSVTRNRGTRPDEVSDQSPKVDRYKQSILRGKTRWIWHFCGLGQSVRHSVSVGYCIKQRQAVYEHRTNPIIPSANRPWWDVPCTLAGDENETQSPILPGPVLHAGPGIPLLFREDQLTRLGPRFLWVFLW